MFIGLPQVFICDTFRDFLQLQIIIDLKNRYVSGDCGFIVICGRDIEFLYYAMLILDS